MKRSVLYRFHWLVAPTLVVAVCASGCSKKHGHKGGKSAPFVGAADASPQKEHSLLKQMDFNDGTSLPWTLSFSDPAKGFSC